MKSVLYALCGFGIAFSPVASAQICRVTNSSLNGAYGYVANQSGFGSTTAGTGTTTGTGGTTGTTTTGSTTSNSSFSSTGLGQLLGGIAGTSQFNLAGRLVFDGAGNIDAGPSASVGATTVVGTYNVNPNCTITVTLQDAFGTNSTPTTLVGVILGGGAEIDLIAPASNQSTTSAGSGSTGSSTGTSTGTSTGASTGGTSTGGNSTPANTQFGSGLAIKLTRILLPYGCSVSNLTGLYGFVLSGAASQTASLMGTTSTGTTTGTGTGTTTGTGTGTTTGTGIGTTTGTGTGTTTGTGTGTTTGTGTGTKTGTSTSGSGLLQPFTLIGTLLFDGNGNVVSNQQAPTSVANLQFTGTYTVNQDCSGTLTLSNAPNPSITSSTPGTTTGSGTGTSTSGSSSTTAASQSFTVNFVLTEPTITVAAGTNLNQYSMAPALDFTVSGPNGTASGYALPD